MSTETLALRGRRRSCRARGRAARAGPSPPSPCSRKRDTADAHPGYAERRKSAASGSPLELAHASRPRLPSPMHLRSRRREADEGADAFVTTDATHGVACDRGTRRRARRRRQRRQRRRGRRPSRCAGVARGRRIRPVVPAFRRLRLPVCELARATLFHEALAVALAYHMLVAAQAAATRTYRSADIAPSLLLRPWRYGTGAVTAAGEAVVSAKDSR